MAFAVTVRWPGGICIMSFEALSKATGITSLDDLVNNCNSDVLMIARPAMLVKGIDPNMQLPLPAFMDWYIEHFGDRVINYTCAEQSFFIPSEVRCIADITLPLMRS